jgi:two-component system cell cycle sensor histidine kinase/response regulator CckA
MGQIKRFAATQMQWLLVGDDERDFVSLRALLAQAGNGQVILDHARSGEEALSLMAATNYDLALCVYKSGDGGVLGLLREVRKNGLGVPVVFLSDHVDQATVTEAIQAGVFAGLPAASPNDCLIAHAICGAIAKYCEEKEHQKTEEMLRKLSRAVEQTADLVIVSDCAGIMEYVNPAFEQLTGYSRREAIGRPLRILRSRQQVPAIYREMWRTVVAGKVFRGTILNRKKNGETFLAERIITPLRDAEQRITHFIFTDRDITERHKLESQLQQAQKMDAIGTLAGGVAHDFNNLLMVISAHAELTLDSLASDHPLRRNLTEIMMAAGRAADLTRQLLAFGRKQIQVLRVLDLNSVIHEVSRMLPHLIGEDIQLAIMPGDDLGKVKADPVQIEQVVMNLAANARDAMPRGGTLTFETENIELDEGYMHRHSMVPAGDYVLLTVTDVGEGIAPEHMPHIFEPFFTTKKEGKGTGLGLATVYGIVKQNGGFIWVYSEPGMGTTFKIYLPRVRQELAKLPPPPAMEKPPRGWETVLLVEDETAVRKSEEEFLRLSGYTVLEAENGENALCVAREHAGPIHLTITDVVMPRMGGAKLAEHLLAERPGIKVLFVSGYAENTVLQHGAIDLTARFLQKPFTLKSLGRKVWEVLQTEEISARAAAGSS